jgi:hypothetical protein
MAAAGTEKMTGCGADKKNKIIAIKHASRRNPEKD